jgi:hypothetical protein
MTRITILIVAALAFAATLPAVPAQAQRDRVFVASYGSDSNPCTFGSPCKTFQNAVNVVAAGGEVTAIDSAGFGTFTISHAVTITSPNGVEAGVAAPSSGGAAITINAGSSDKVVLNGLTLDGDGVSNTTGISFGTGGRLEIRNSVIRNFGGYGIAISTYLPNSIQLSVSNTVISDNGTADSGTSGITISSGGTGTVTCVFDHVAIENNQGDGLFLNSATQAIVVTLGDSVIANNTVNGILAQQGTAQVYVAVKRSNISNNGTGANTSGGAVIRLSQSVITANSTGWAGSVDSTVDNLIDDNSSGNGAPPTLAYK